jgi:hypothetical protein
MQGLHCLESLEAIPLLLWQEDMVSVARFVTDCFDFLRSADSPSNQP